MGMFVSPDTIVPDGGVVSDYNRYLAFRGNPLRFKDPTGHFTDDAIKKYLRDTHKGLWEEYYNLWTANKAWMDMLYTAVAGDIFATIDSSSGASSFYQFTGEGKDVLTGAVDIYGLAETGPSIMLEVLRPNSNEAVASGLLRLNGESFEVVETMSFRQKGKPSTSYYLEAGKPLTKMQSYGWKLARALGFTGMGTAVGEGITRGAVWKLGPQIAGKYNGAIFIASALGGFATEQLLEGTAANIGWEEGHQQIFLHSLTVSYNEYVTSQTIVGSWWWVPPQPGGAVAQ